MESLEGNLTLVDLHWAHSSAEGWASPLYLQTLTAVLLLLGFATLVSWFLHRRRPQNETFAKVVVIVRSWWLIAGTFILSLAWQPWGTFILMYALSLFALREYLRVSHAPSKGYLIAILSVLTTLQYAVLAFRELTLFAALLPVLCLWIVPALVIFRATIGELELVTSVGVGLTLLIYYMSHVVALLMFPELGLNRDQSMLALFILILVTWSNDVFQFIAGKSVGKRKIVPQVSPNKTLGGFLGGIVGTTILMTAIAPPVLGLSFFQSATLGAVLGLTGMLGDLYFSAVKRRVGVKDFSQVLPGHGGLLDRLDSLIFTAPIYFYCLLIMKGH